MSEIFNQEMSLTQALDRASIIVVAESLGKRENLKRVVFPKSTHFAKAEESVYSEDADLFRVSEILRDTNKKMVVGQTVKVWAEPDYRLNAIRRAHENGEKESPIVSVYSSKFPVEGASRILFLRPDPESRPAVFLKVAEEGIAGRAMVETSLKSPPPSPITRRK